MKPNRFALSLSLLLLGGLAGCGGRGSTAEVGSTGGSVDANATTASLSGVTFDFGNNFVGGTVTQSVVTVSNTGSAELTLNPALAGDASFTLRADQSCPGKLAANQSCSIAVSYTPVTASAPAQQSATLNLHLGNVDPATAQSVALTGVSGTVSAGTVTPTQNPQVALYTITLPFAGSVNVAFGTGAQHYLVTSPQTAPAGGGVVNILVAGMLASTQYHMRAIVQLANGALFDDVDHTFTTGALPSSFHLQLATSTASGMTPQPGVELLNQTGGGPVAGFATDLAGNVIWTYPFPDAQQLSLLAPIKLLPNGHFIVLVGDLKQVAGGGGTTMPSPVSLAREIDLAGNTIRQLTNADLDTRLQQAGFDLVVSTFSHDILVLPNGHWLLIGSTVKTLNDLQGFSGPITVTGDVVIDLDANLQPVWVWNSFDHLDVNRHPLSFPDWTHANALLYSADDGNLLFSLRHQNWVLKLNYQDGKGNGDVLWRLGLEGDFTLVGGTDPTDWFYAQHGFAFFSPNTAGTFTLGVWDNGNDRHFPIGVTCSAAGAPPCFYSTVPVLQINESARTATFVSHQILPPAEYGNFGGNIEQLANANIAYDDCGLEGIPSSRVREITPGNNPQAVWEMDLNTPETFFYRAMRLPSLYPGVQW